MNYANKITKNRRIFSKQSQKTDEYFTISHIFVRKVGRERLSSFAIATYNSPSNWGRIIFSRENYTNNLSASAITPFASRQRVHEVLLITSKTMSSKRMICLILNCMYFPFSPTKLLYFLRPSKSFRLFLFFSTILLD